MTDPGRSDLYVATYDEPYDALRDFRALEAVVDDGCGVLGAIAILRPADGKVDFLAAAEDAGEYVDWFGGATGIIVGFVRSRVVAVGGIPQGREHSFGAAGQSPRRGAVGG